MGGQKSLVVTLNICDKIVFATTPGSGRLKIYNQSREGSATLHSFLSSAVEEVSGHGLGLVITKVKIMEGSRKLSEDTDAKRK